MTSLYPFLQVYNSSRYLSIIKPLMYEYQIAALFNYFLENNQNKKSFETIASSG
ncbi:hypothetical protein [Candidatus Phytoplasma tritici]|uniref:hypothetical protein n=1 Tax=Candidatus Phytoplasma tritici TaxID=321961 RepID=UPI0004296DD5|nr:hypothetical protein [Candidatus Phytoplasma tritici]